MSLGLMAKFKLLTSFYQICTNLQAAYAVQFPPRVAEILEKIADLVTLNFDELWKPLQCLQLRGFHDQLLVLVVGPLVLVALTPLATGLLGCWRQRRAPSDEPRPGMRAR